MEARARRTGDSRLAVLVLRVAAHGKRLFRYCSGCRETFGVRAIISSAESGFERRATQADRVTGAEAAWAKVVAASVTGARCAPDEEFRQRLGAWGWRIVCEDGSTKHEEAIAVQQEKSGNPVKLAVEAVEEHPDAGEADGPDR